MYETADKFIHSDKNPLVLKWYTSPLEIDCACAGPFRAKDLCIFTNEVNGIEMNKRPMSVLVEIRWSQYY